MNNAASLIGLAAVVSSVALLVHVIAAAWSRRQRADRAWWPERDTARLIGALQDQVTRVERTLEAQAIDLERLAEGQRFAARLLAERGAGGSDRPSGAREAARVSTPH